MVDAVDFLDTVDFLDVTDFLDAVDVAVNIPVIRHHAVHLMDQSASWIHTGA
ncbi:MAG: hypothetical protein JWR12_2229 [Mucilaginibacter sp.]|nr:hypothetical protein [Mucilaginibacter sp.]